MLIKFKKTIRFLILLFFGLLVTFLAGTAIFLKKEQTDHNNWQFYSIKSIGPNGRHQLRKNLFFIDNLLIFSSQDNSTYALYPGSGALAWQFTAQNYSPFPATAAEGRVFLANFDGNVYALDQKTGYELWRFAIPEQISPDTPVLVSADQQLVFVTSRAGGLYALDSNNGQLRWQRQFATPNLQSAFVTGTIHFGSIYSDENNLYVINAPEKAAFAFRQRDGLLLWQVRNLSYSSTPPLVSNDYLVFYQTDRLVVVNKQNGQEYDIVRTINPESRLKMFPAKGEEKALFLIDGHRLRKIDLQSSATVWQIDNISGVLEDIEKNQLIFSDDRLVLQKFDNLNNYNTLKAVDQQSGQIIWQTLLPINTVAKTLLDESTLYLAENNGSVLALDAKNGNILWQKKVCAAIIDLYQVEHKLLAVCDRNGDKITLYYLDADNNGEIMWSYTPEHKVEDNNIYFHDNAFYTLNTQKQLLEKIVIGDQVPSAQSIRHLNFSSEENFSNHDPFLELKNRNSLSWQLRRLYLRANYFLTAYWQNSGFELQSNIGPSSIEFDLYRADYLYRNPYTDLRLSAVFTNLKTKEKTTVSGYYYDKNHWKLSFTPAKSGEYSWRLTVRDGLGGKSWSDQGKLTANNKQALTIQDKHFMLGEQVFLPIGIQNAFFDYNYDGNYSNQINHSIAEAPVTSTDDYAYTDLDQYLDLYVKEAGVNLFRYGVENAAPALYQSINPEQIIWDVNGGKAADQVIDAANRHDLRVMMSIFGFYPPFISSAEIAQTDKQRAIEQYLDYVIARYSAKIDLWEICNEATPSREWYEFVIGYLREHDPYQRPISTNWEEPDLANLDYLSIHWYNPDSNSAEAIADAINFIGNAHSHYPQPVLISELGFKNSSWFEGSTTALRIISWLSSFKQMGIVFWNQGQNGIYQNPNNANAYLGPLERGTLRQLSAFFPAMSLPIEQEMFTIEAARIQLHVLKNQDYYLAYLLKLNANNSPEGNLKLSLEKDATVEWLDPASGRLLSQSQLSRGQQLLPIPNFSTDLALRISYQQAVDNNSNKAPVGDSDGARQ